MKKTTAVKMILNNLIDGGLPRAIEIYNYLTCYGEIDIKENDINKYFRMQ